MKFSDYKDAQDFLQKSGLDPDSAITFLDDELKKLRSSEHEKCRDSGKRR